MTLSPNINDREKDKFIDDPDGGTTVRVSDAVGGWVFDSVGRKIAVAYPTGTTETYTYYDTDGTTVRAVILVTYVASDKLEVSSVERTS